MPISPQYDPFTPESNDTLILFSPVTPASNRQVFEEVEQPYHNNDSQNLFK